ncbi:MAG: type II secretion system protein [Candidatus Anstonellales archaeon]
MREKFKNLGVTIVELLIVVVMMSIITLGISTFFHQGLNFVRLIQAKIEVQRDARTILSMITRKLREAKSSTVVISRLDASNPPYSKISFTTIEDEEITYYQDGTRLMFQLKKGSTSFTPKKLTENLRYVHFVYQRTDNSKILHISVCLEKIPYPYVAGAKALQVSIEQVRIMN